MTQHGAYQGLKPPAGLELIAAAQSPKDLLAPYRQLTNRFSALASLDDELAFLQSLD